MAEAVNNPMDLEEISIFNRCSYILILKKWLQVTSNPFFICLLWECYFICAMNWIRAIIMLIRWKPINWNQFKWIYAFTMNDDRTQVSKEKKNQPSNWRFFSPLNVNNAMWTMNLRRYALAFRPTRIFHFSCEIIFIFHIALYFLDTTKKSTKQKDWYTIWRWFIINAIRKFNKNHILLCYMNHNEARRSHSRARSLIVMHAPHTPRVWRVYIFYSYVISVCVA